MRNKIGFFIKMLKILLRIVLKYKKKGNEEMDIQLYFIRMFNNNTELHSVQLDSIICYYICFFFYLIITYYYT